MGSTGGGTVFMAFHHVFSISKIPYSVSVKTYLFQEQTFYGCLLSCNSSYFKTQGFIYHKIKKKKFWSTKELL